MTALYGLIGQHLAASVQPRHCFTLRVTEIYPLRFMTCGQLRRHQNARRLDALTRDRRYRRDVGPPCRQFANRGALFGGSTRYGEFQRSLGIATNVLQDRLDGFIAAGLMERRPSSELKNPTLDAAATRTVRR